MKERGKVFLMGHAYQDHVELQIWATQISLLSKKIAIPSTLENSKDEEPKSIVSDIEGVIGR